MRSLWISVILHALAYAQSAVEMPAGVTRLEGVDAQSGIAYAMLSVEGKAAGGGAPRLTAVCKKLPEGKWRFELWADEPGLAGKAPQLAFVPPWRQTGSELFPPRLTKVNVTLEFLGYRKVKPVTRQWAYLLELPGELRYATPGRDSSNMEEIAFYLQYLKALPTLRLTLAGRGSEEFETTRWQAAVKAEPLCRASGY